MRCIGVKPDGSLCKGLAKAGSDFCPAHNPARAEARKRAASKAARSKPGHEFLELKSALVQLYDDVLNLTTPTGVAAVATQIVHARIRLLECERRVREADLLEARLEELEAALDRRAR